MFWSNLKQIIINSPLVLSDSYDPKDISFHRVTGFIITMLLIIVIFRVLITPTLASEFLQIIDKLLIALGAILTANTFKKGFDVFKNNNQNQMQYQNQNKLRGEDVK